MSDTPLTDAAKIACGFQAVPESFFQHACQLERKNAVLRSDLLIEEERSIYWRDNEGKAMAENAALRADIHAHEQINRQLIEDKRRLDWLLTDDGGFWVNWMYDKDEWMPELKASRDAIDACRNGRIGREKP
jgi:hypothetical protein